MFACTYLPNSQSHVHTHSPSSSSRTRSITSASNSRRATNESNQQATTNKNSSYHDTQNYFATFTSYNYNKCTPTTKTQKQSNLNGELLECILIEEDETAVERLPQELTHIAEL
jgi:hypothetical protein